MTTIKRNGVLYFSDYPDFTPNLTPQEIFKLGSFGGTYWRPIYSSIVSKKLKNQHIKYSKLWFKGIPDNHMIVPWASYDKNINKYKVKVGTTLEFWEEKIWIVKSHPYGWVQWFCDFCMGERGPDDERQINRWKRTAGPNSRFRKQLINKIKLAQTTYDDYTISPKIRQTLQHWAVQLTNHDL